MFDRYFASSIVKLQNPIIQIQTGIKTSSVSEFCMSISNEKQDHQLRNEERRFILWSIARANPGRGKHPWRPGEDRNLPSNESSICTTGWRLFLRTTYSFATQFLDLASLLFAKAKRIDRRIVFSLVGLGGLLAYFFLQTVLAEKAYLIEELTIRNLAEEYQFELGSAQGESDCGANVIAVRAPGTGIMNFLGIRSFDRVVRLEIKRYEDVSESSLIALAKLPYLERMVLGDRGPGRFYILTNSELKKNWNRVLHIFTTMKRRQNR